MSQRLRLDDLDYHLPPELIAQHPAARREDARLLVVERGTGTLHDSRIASIGLWLRSGDALAVNETRVRPARLELLRSATRGRVEILFVRPAPMAAEGAVWRVLARPAKRVREGERLETPDGSLEIDVIESGADGERVVRVTRGDLARTLGERGELALPPYIHHAPGPTDRDRYQTVFARVEGAIAAPTAGLHFTDELLRTLALQGVATVRTLLHVGPGTFRPITSGDPRAHRMDEEYYEVSAEAAAALTGARAAGDASSPWGPPWHGRWSRRATRTTAAWRRRGDGPASTSFRPTRFAGWTPCSPTFTCPARRSCCWSRRSRGRR